MGRADDLRLADIQEAAGTIALLVARGRGAYDDDPAVRPAIERLLEIVGEAANAMSATSRDRYPAVPWRDVTRLRHRLAHHYHRVDPDQVWAIATVDMPELVRRLDAGPPS